MSRSTPRQTLVLGTRGSQLARAQTRWVIDRLRAAHSQLEIHTEIITTTGDRQQDHPLPEVGGKGVFTEELERALLAGSIDVAVHSAKDLPTAFGSELEILAFPAREDPRDALCARERGATLADLPRGARVGTGSTRRMALLRAHRPDLELVPLRGNVPTRLAKLEEGLDAVVLACAGLDRLGRSEAIDERVAPEILLPAVGQGLLALETREGDEWQARIARLPMYPREIWGLGRLMRTLRERLRGTRVGPYTFAMVNVLARRPAGDAHLPGGGGG